MAVRLARLAIPLLLAAAPAVIAAAPGALGVTLSYRDLDVKPGDDFDEYANGAWRRATEIPADRSSTGVGFEVFQRAEQRNAELVRDAGAGHAAPGTPQRMIADYYAAYMDKAGIDARGLTPLRPRFGSRDNYDWRGELDYAFDLIDRQ